MAHWGVAYASGPFYNYVWAAFGPNEIVEMTAFCHSHVVEAQRYMEHATEAERALIGALAMRFQEPHPVSADEFKRWDDEYADAMRQVHRQFPDDHDVMSLFVESMLVRTPWKLWNVDTGEPAEGADTLEAIAVCEKSLALSEQSGEPPHPGILHLHIHALEMSDAPERAMGSADALRDLCPDAGHMNHMPGHIYVLCGEYEKARIASAKAIAADDQYVEYAGPFNFYTTSRCHDYHLMMYTCMLQGRFDEALAAAEGICETLTPEVLSRDDVPQLVATMEGYFSMSMHVLVRFGRWQEIIDAPLPADPALYCVSTSMYHYAKGVAHAFVGDFEAAEQSRADFATSLEAIPESRGFFNNSAHDLLAVGEKMLDGEVAYHRGNYTEAFDHLREGVRRDDGLSYNEPWAWMHPPRHALGALLIEQGHFDEAEEVYRADLGLSGSLQRCSQHPKNVWSLHGLVECLRNRSASNPADPEELVHLEGQLAEAQSFSDVPIESSCMCRRNVES